VTLGGEKPSAVSATLQVHEDRYAPPDPRRLTGQLLAVCGLCGGAGASTLAYLIALAEAQERPGSVLVGDTGGPGGGIACYAGVMAPRSLAEVADHVVAGLPVGDLVATTAEGVRVLATGPRFAVNGARDGIEVLLDHARERYALTVMDCGTLAREADQVALARASHVAWVLPATAGALHRARNVLKVINPYLTGTEILVARNEDRGPKAPIRELRRLAEQRHAPLVLFPSLPDLAIAKAKTALEAAQVSLQAIRGLLSR